MGAERREHRHQRAADAARADDRDGPALDAAGALAQVVVPLARPRAVGDAVQTGEHEAERVLGDRLGEGAGHRGDDRAVGQRVDPALDSRGRQLDPAHAVGQVVGNRRAVEPDHAVGGFERPDHTAARLDGRGEGVGGLREDRDRGTHHAEFRTPRGEPGASSLQRGAARGWCPSRSSKPVSRRSPAVGWFDSSAAP